MRLLILVITVTSILASSCTIQKRTFRSGYYISWNKPLKEKKTPKMEDEAAIVPKEEVNIMENRDTLQTDSLVISSSLSEVKETDVLEEVVAIDEIKEELQVETIGIKPKQQLETEDEPQKKIDLFAANSLGFSLIYVGLLLLSIAMDLSESIGCLAILALLICIAFAIISFVRRKRHPEKYKGTWMSVVALIILALATTAMFGFLISTI
jgi:hypothetical protein